jgi:hypothetical protein
VIGITDLRAALTTGDVPTAELWLQTAMSRDKAFERGVGILEALADPLLDDHARLYHLDDLLDQLENWLAVDEANTRSVLAQMIAHPERLHTKRRQDRIAALGKFAGVSKMSAAMQERYAVCRERLIDLAPKGRSKPSYRVDRKSGLMPAGPDVAMTREAVIALAELRRTAARLCLVLSEDALGALNEYDGAAQKYDYVCSSNVAMATIELVRKLEQLSSIAEQAWLRA